MMMMAQTLCQIWAAAELSTSIHVRWLTTQCLPLGDGHMPFLAVARRPSHARPLVATARLAATASGISNVVVTLALDGDNDDEDAMLPFDSAAFEPQVDAMMLQEDARAAYSAQVIVADIILKYRSQLDDATLP
ncbi:hypothetical protein SDRG_02290 [Saprolegnia diclina VS20]|uniref:Uncharacterized protein n=1 Tax=Saprolegnia diclina (strain VS20) TaxID=1156394 RepID=T0S5D3_SAPDV|nr:hypothetical protein SDRG_02290 [Saprolegnia diclina VS20]EQC40393.1 hypothetical protein SDRG_02290 [Saprolegnia diclina VS20]|eukprot:XP_008606092.1 hypothetical protein SDRG_02290 [Saprolegnia diclina VS20]